MTYAHQLQCPSDPKRCVLHQRALPPIQGRRSAAINIALPAEQQRTSLHQIDRGRQRPVIKRASHRNEAETLNGTSLPLIRGNTFGYNKSDANVLKCSQQQLTCLDVGWMLKLNL